MRFGFSLMLFTALLTVWSTSGPQTYRSEVPPPPEPFSLAALEPIAAWHLGTFVNAQHDARQAELLAQQSQQTAAPPVARRVEVPRTVVPATSPTSPASQASASVWDRLAYCESGGNWSYNGSSGYDGGLQFLPSTWTSHGGGMYAAYAWQASRAEQIAVAERVLRTQGWRAWPACSRKLGLR